uniref:Uncharacterized protein n=1 Tax=Mucochytrium quahogii TaxID=96639 RepID=A0A7S2SDV3_9STRA|mmetsp:Transcript_14473/g.23559  ORF Transcript_14473/g.23559 Transcript_14473/m.23559 type:complete len:210 (+) Transcript_14473:276-905(+)|eukprot:CAMPEP_0203749782 /NCGR_PEP_ID=MMETSP0098-20131031/4200_1 /ASSEMBLY_ACC=CAM_ASM_000208 /TAXON_ID=96639 /ORGANISM=" , Strain NY0313808BC1" /LENGTH=209 /DNA_ID=CAMNT_0050638881 /DNA_START=33 /DNA_END=662 /DNA_ORIENTATION=+
MDDVDPDHRKAFRLFRVFKTIMKMLHNRKYLVSQSEIELTFADFKSRYQYPVDKNLMLLLVSKVDDPNDQMFVFFPTEEKVDVNCVGHYAEKMSKQEVRKAILVVEKDISPFARKALAEAQPMYFIEVFKESELLVDITEHELVPKHEVLSSEEKDQLMKRYKLKDSQLPRMYITDPITRYFGLVRGQVVKIIRSSETAGRYVSYRIVY